MNNEGDTVDFYWNNTEIARQQEKEADGKTLGLYIQRSNKLVVGYINEKEKIAGESKFQISFQIT